VPHVVAGALELAARDTEAADVKEPVVPLSPACASFDQLRNFAARVDAFRELVLALPGVVAKG
jgi:UDP-N-acetylmuramoylalanine--D-glutamate ligase